MKNSLAICLVLVFTLLRGFAEPPDGLSPMPENRQLNNLVALLLEVAPTPGARSFSFVRPSAGWIFISYTAQGGADVQLTLDKGTPGEIPIYPATTDGSTGEAVHCISQGQHTLQIEGPGVAAVERLTVKAIPELIYSGLGYEPQIKAYGPYDLHFLKRDILPNITTTIIPSALKLASSDIEAWHRQGKRYLAEVGIDAQAKTADAHAAYWTSFFTNTPFIDGIIIDEFIVNRPIAEWVPVLTPKRAAKFDEERASYQLYTEAFQKMHADPRLTNKLVYAYVGGSGKKLNQEIIGTNVLRSLINCGYFVSPERYLHEMSSEKGSREALPGIRRGPG